MFPQAELENYKLQVELLQEKLQRSEENREQLKHKLEKILQKRNELDKSIRHKTRQKYQEFLDEQQRRNERNKTLVKMLEQIDQQTAAMSARSERLKMMKLQYQMYFAKLVQNQTMRSLQQTVSSTIPILVTQQTTPTNSSQAGEITNLPCLVVPNNMDVTTAQQKVCMIANSNEIGSSGAAKTPQWMLPLTTPMQTGIMLTPHANYLAYPSGIAGYMPRSHKPQMGFDEFLFGNANTATAAAATAAGIESNIYDLRANLRSFDNEPNTAADLRKSMYADGEEMGNFVNTTLSEMMKANMSMTGEQQQQQPVQRQRQQQKQQQREQQQIPKSVKGKNINATPATEAETLSSTSSTLATSSLTFDKLPKMMLSGQAPAEQQLKRSHSHDVDDNGNNDDDDDDIAVVAATLTSNSINDDIGRPQMIMKPHVETTNAQTARGHIDFATNNVTLPNSRVTKVEQEILSSEAELVSNEKVNEQQQWQQQQQLWKNVKDNFRGLKIDEQPWQAGTWQRTSVQQSQLEPEMNINSYAYEEARAALAAAVSLDEQQQQQQQQQQEQQQQQQFKAQCNQLSTNIELAAKPTMSIENIENAIYGELLNPATVTTTTTTMLPSRTMTAKVEDTRNAAQGLFTNLVTTQEEPQIAANKAELTEPIVDITTVAATEATTSIATELSSNNADYSTYERIENYGNTLTDEQSNVNESYEPIYATIDDNVTTAATEQSETIIEPTYNEISNGYQQRQQQQKQQQLQQQQQQQQQEYEEAAIIATAANVSQENYTNIDYGNYDGTQYDGCAYDPNAYPGYIYDETTGQYIADPNATQYATEENYTAQNYEDNASAATNYEYNTDYAQPEVEQAPEIEHAAPVNVDIHAIDATTQQLKTNELLPEVTNAADVSTCQPTEITADSAGMPPPPAKPIKPTSILSTSSIADKQAAPNDAQHKKKKRVNFVDSSETDDSSSAKSLRGPTNVNNVGGVSGVSATGDANSESDFDFSVSGEAQN